MLLKRELAETQEQLAATADVLRIIASSPGELEPVFKAMLANAVRICGAKFGTLYRYDGETLHVAALHNAPREFAEARRQAPLRLSNKTAGTALDRAIKTKKVVQIADVREEPAYRADPLRMKFLTMTGARSLLCVPILKDDEPIGVIAIYRQEVRPFSDQQIALVTNFAGQALIAIENTRLFSELRQRTDDLTESLEQQTATSEVLQVISTSPGELKPVFESMLANATRICEAPFGNLFLCEGDDFRCVAVHSKESYVEYYRRDPVIAGPDTAGIPLDRVRQSKQVLHIVDMRQDASYLAGNKRIVTLVEVAGARTFLNVPMLREGEFIGAIAMYRQEVRPFSREADRTGEEFRRAGRHRHREHPAAQ